MLWLDIADTYQMIFTETYTGVSYTEFMRNGHFTENLVHSTPKNPTP